MVPNKDVSVDGLPSYHRRISGIWSGLGLHHPAGVTLTFRIQVLQRFCCLLIHIGAVNNVKLKSLKSQSPACQFCSVLSSAKVPSSCVMICLNRKAGYIQTRSQRCYSPFDFQELLLRSGQFFVLFLQCTRLVANRAVIALFQFLQEYYTIYLSQASVSSVFYSLFLGSTCTGELIWASFHDATVAFSFSSRWPNWLSCFFPKFLLKGAAKRVKFGMNRRNTLHRPEKKQCFSFVVGCSSFATTSVVCRTSTRRPGRIMWPI